MSYHDDSWLVHTFISPFPMTGWDLVTSSPRCAQVRHGAMSAYLRWILRLLSVSPDEAIIEEIAQKPEEAGHGPSIEMNYMANLRLRNFERNHGFCFPSFFSSWFNCGLQVSDALIDIHAIFQKLRHFSARKVDN